MERTEPLLKIEDIYKNFEGVKAVDGITLELSKGDIIGLVGENGAGKSTLVKLVVGVHRKSKGKIFFNNEEVFWNNPNEAIMAGVGLIHQKPALVPDLTAAECIFLGKEFSYMGLIKKKTINKQAKKLLEEFPINKDFDFRKKVKDMTAGEREITEIMRVLSHRPQILIFDEPTASLNRNESENLLSIIRSLNEEQQVSVIFISHRLEEVFQLVDSIEVLRNGKKVGRVDKSQFNKNEIIKMIINRDLSEFYPPKSKKVEDKVLEIKKFSSDKVRNINLHICKGEIVGLYGLSGAGMSETVEAMFGLYPADEGELYLHDRKTRSNVARLKQNNVYLIPEDRDVKGLFSNFSVKENLTISHLNTLLRSFLISNKEEEQLVMEGINRNNIVCRNMNDDIHSLSGGNQQKVVITKWLMKECEVLVLNDPTVGVDVGTKREIYLMLRKLTDAGKGVLFISSDILEIIGMSDRIYTMRRGEISKELQGNEINQENILMNVL